MERERERDLTELRTVHDTLLQLKEAWHSKQGSPQVVPQSTNEN